MRTHSVLRCLPLLADVLGRSYGVTVEIGGRDAFTTGRTIRLPSLPAEADPSFLGLVRGYIDHESAHVRHTDFEAITKEAVSPLERHIWNCFEDWRVEELLAGRFPGCRQNFRWLIRHLFLHRPSPRRSPADRVADWLLTTVRSWAVPDLALQCQAEAKAIERRWPGLVSEMEAILARMQIHCPDSLACLAYAREVVACLARRDGFDTLIAAPEFPNDLGQLMRQEIGEKVEQVGRCAVATIGEKPLAPLTGQQLADIARITAGLRARFHGLFQASRLVRQMPSRRGRLDCRRLHAVSVNDPAVFLTHRRKPAVNTAVHILLDASSSMRQRIDLACQCCAVLAQALRQTGVSVALTAFPGASLVSGGPTVAPILKAGEKPHGNLLVTPSGQTPLAEALWWVLQRMATARQDRRIILIVTDGAPDNPSGTRDAIQAARSLGVEVFGLGIDAPCIVGLMPGGSASIERLEALPAALFALLGNALVRQGRAA
ncbi:MAG: VWA domain-containing protein [Rhodospirillales bacterium]|jgi:hypothetical protein|nr:VWA domain-containing protein [Rhodospirillales bacterium]